jgi:hypothetical protein
MEGVTGSIPVAPTIESIGCAFLRLSTNTQSLCFPGLSRRRAGAMSLMPGKRSAVRLPRQGSVVDATGLLPLRGVTAGSTVLDVVLR